MTRIKWKWETIAKKIIFGLYIVLYEIMMLKNVKNVEAIEKLKEKIIIFGCCYVDICLTTDFMYSVVSTKSLSMETLLSMQWDTRQFTLLCIFSLSTVRSHFHS